MAPEDTRWALVIQGYEILEGCPTILPTWVRRSFSALRRGDVFLLFEEDGTPVPCQDSGVSPMLAEGDVHLGAQGQTLFCVPWDGRSMPRVSALEGVS